MALGIALGMAVTSTAASRTAFSAGTAIDRAKESFRLKVVRRILWLTRGQ
jgi:hypothetical protein